MKVVQKCLAMAATAAAGYLIFGIAGAKATTFSFSLEFGTGNPRDVNYRMGRHLFSGKFTGEDINNDGLLFYSKDDPRNELSEFSVTWAGFEFGLEDLQTFVAGTLPYEPKSYYGEDILVRWIQVARDALHLDYKPAGRLGIPKEWYQKFRVYQCPATLDCNKLWTIDYALADRLMSPENLLGFENIFNPGFPAYLVQDPVDPDPNPDPGESVPEPSLIGGLALLALASWRKRKIAR